MIEFPPIESDTEEPVRIEHEEEVSEAGIESDLGSAETFESEVITPDSYFEEVQVEQFPPAQESTFKTGALLAVGTLILAGESVVNFFRFKRR